MNDNFESKLRQHWKSTKPDRKSDLLHQINQLKLLKPDGWRVKLRSLVRYLQNICAQDDFRETFVNSDMQGYESVGRKCRSSRIQPPL